ncbi:MAG: hypothetical protein DRP87_12610 [Spirochaetes bacterium]|nr:MAG: hypothetical protein DRP87_12610 [Spirochaetota bacterium]
MRLKNILVLPFLLITINLSFTEEKPPTPEPYTKEEFPQWLHDLRRAEIILVGSFPITLFFTSVGYDIFRYVSREVEETPVPGMFGTLRLIPLTKEEKIGILITAVSISACITIADLIINKIIKKKEQKDERNFQSK